MHTVRSTHSHTCQSKSLYFNLATEVKSVVLHAASWEQMQPFESKLLTWKDI